LRDKLRDSIVFNEYPHEKNDLVIRTPFDKDKLPTRNSKTKMINPKFVSREIQSTSLFVMYYPDTSM